MKDTLNRIYDTAFELLKGILFITTCFLSVAFIFFVVVVFITILIHLISNQ